MRPRRPGLLFLSALLTACASDTPREPLAANHEEVKVCAAGPTLDGIDVSAWQETVDWTKVKNAGIDFAFIRVSDGLGYVDAYFPANWAGAKQAGIVRGAYQFVRFDEDIIAQADLLVAKVGTLGETDLPPVIDVESTDGQSPAVIAQKVGQWIERVEQKTGKRPIIYTGKYFWNDNVGSSAFADDPLWIPQYGPVCPDLPDPWTTWAFFQTSDKGSVPGVSGNCDVNLFNGDMAALLALARGTVECGDGACNGDETGASCPVDCPVCAPVPAEGRVIDETDACAEQGGTPAALRRVEGAGQGDTLTWTKTTDWDMADNFARWDLELAEAGRYRVEVYTDARYAEATRATYTVRHAGTSEDVVLDQSAADGWQTLGEFAFAAGGDQSLHVGDNTGEALATDTQLVFDAIRLTRVDGGSPGGDDPGGDPAGDPGADDGGTMGGGCHVGAGRAPLGAPWWNVLVTIGLTTLGYARRHAPRHRRSLNDRAPRPRLARQRW